MAAKASIASSRGLWAGGAMNRAYGATGKPGCVWENSCEAGLLERQSLVRTLGWTFDV
jgi:hypothetical protein